MNAPFAFAVILLASSVFSFGKEAFVSLTNYVTTAEAICVCTVHKDNGDQTVTVEVGQILKGKLEKKEILRGETGHCVVQGPVSQFMKPQERYLVFIFKDNKVGRLGGILPIQDKLLHARLVHGFAGAKLDRKVGAHTIRLEEAIKQIETMLKNGPNLRQAEAQKRLPL